MQAPWFGFTSMVLTQLGFLLLSRHMTATWPLPANRCQDTQVIKERALLPVTEKWVGLRVGTCCYTHSWWLFTSWGYRQLLSSFVTIDGNKLSITWRVPNSFETWRVHTWFACNRLSFTVVQKLNDMGRPWWITTYGFHKQFGSSIIMLTGLVSGEIYIQESLVLTSYYKGFL